MFAALEKLVMPEGNRASYRQMLRSAVKMTMDTREFTLRKFCVGWLVT